MEKLVQIVLIAIVAVRWRWYSYVTNTETPHDEGGIQFNSRILGPINKWECDKLRATFGDVVPPLGCRAGGEGRAWR